MRSYGARLARLEKALLPKPPVTIRIEYVEDWRGASMPPVAAVAPGLLERLGTKDDTPADAPATTTPASSAPGEPEQRPWSFEQAMWSYRDPPAGPNLRRMRAMARKAAQADERRR